MRYRSDIQLNDDQDIYINPETNDFDFGPSDTQHIVDILMAFPGWYKNSLSLGVGVMQYLKSKAKFQQLVRSIMINLQSDGYNVNSDISIQNFSIEKIIANCKLK